MLYQGFVLVFYIEASSHILFWGFGLVLYWGFVLIFYFEALAWYYIEALSSYFILRLRPHILFEALSSYFLLRLRPRILFWGFVLIFHIEALSSYFILRPRPRILFRGFVLIFYIEALSSYFIYPYNTFWGFVLWLLVDSSTLAFGVVVNLLFIYYFGIYRGVFCVDLMSDRLSLPHFYCVM